MEKTIFITGASAGLGRETAKLFQSKGWKVIATMRNTDDAKELKNLDNVTVLPLDVTDTVQIVSTIKQVLDYANVDVILNNAGYGLIGALESLSNEQISKQINTNLIGVVSTCKAFLSHMRIRKTGTIINVTSMFGLIGYPTCSIYAASKFAIEGFSESLAYELAQFNIKVKTITPGGIKTDFAGRSMDTGQHDAYQKLVAKVSEGYSEEQRRRYSTAAEVAAVIYEAATDNKEQLRYVVGNDAIRLYNARTNYGAAHQYTELRKQFLF